MTQPHPFRYHRLARGLFVGSRSEIIQMAYGVFLDDDLSLRQLVVALLTEGAGIRCLAFNSVAMFIADPNLVLGSSVAILDVNLGLGQPSGLDAYDWLCKHGYQGKIVFLTGHAHSHPLVRQAKMLKGVDVLLKPIGLQTLLQLFEPARPKKEENDHQNEADRGSI